MQEGRIRSEEHTSELQSHVNLVCRLLLEKTEPDLGVKQGHPKLRDDARCGWGCARGAQPLAADALASPARPTLLSLCYFYFFFLNDRGPPESPPFPPHAPFLI